MGTLTIQLNRGGIDYSTSIVHFPPLSLKK